MGFVTSGNFSLSRGKGFAIGAVSLVKFLETREQAHRRVFDSLFHELFLRARADSNTMCPD